VGGGKEPARPAAILDQVDVGEGDLAAAGGVDARDVGAGAGFQVLDDEAGLALCGEGGGGLKFLDREVTGVDADLAFIAERVGAFLKRHGAEPLMRRESARRTPTSRQNAAKSARGGLRCSQGGPLRHSDSLTDRDVPGRGFEGRLLRTQTRIPESRGLSGEAPGQVRLEAGSGLETSCRGWRIGVRGAELCFGHGSAFPQVHGLRGAVTGSFPHSSVGVLALACGW